MRNFDVLYLEEAETFLMSLDTKVRNKIFYNIEKARSINDPQLFKKLNSNIWEFRTLYNGLQYRMLAFWDNRKSAFVVGTHVFIKKTDKVPKSEIERSIVVKMEKKSADVSSESLDKAYAILKSIYDEEYEVANQASAVLV